MIEEHTEPLLNKFPGIDTKFKDLSMDVRKHADRFQRIESSLETLDKTAALIRA